MKAKFLKVFAVRGGGFVINQNEKKPQNNEKTPQLFFAEDIDNKDGKCYN